MFLASDAPLDVELEAARTGRPFVDDPEHYTRFGMDTVEDLLAALALDEQGILSFARRAEISTDDNNLMATRSRARADGLEADELLELFEPHEPMGREGSWIHTLLADSIDYGYLARRLLGTGQTARVTRLAGAIPDFSRQFQVYSLLFRATDQDEQAPEALLKRTGRQPAQHAGALYHYKGPSRCHQRRRGAGGNSGDRRGTHRARRRRGRGPALRGRGRLGVAGVARRRPGRVPG